MSLSGVNSLVEGVKHFVQQAGDLVRLVSPRYPVDLLFGNPVGARTVPEFIEGLLDTNGNRYIGPWGR
jgi:hypothetical protein